MNDLDNTPRTPKQYARIFSTGAAMGIADIIPGVSGGTMAFILGIYADLLNAIKSVNLDFLRALLGFRLREALGMIPWAFLITLGLGIGTAVLSLATLIDWLLVNETVYLFAFFFGLILASILAVGAKIRLTAAAWGLLALGTLIAFGVVNLIPLDMPNDPLTLFASGAIAITAMILPGISGSFLLLILGQYDYVIAALKTRDILALLPMAAGCAVGLLLFVRVLSWMLARYHDTTIALLVGFMIGSLWKIWPWKIVLEYRIDSSGVQVPLVERNILPAIDASFWFALALCVAGFVLVSVLDHLQSRENPLFSLFGRGQRGRVPATREG